jgi:hypothetical protein
MLRLLHNDNGQQRSNRTDELDLVGVYRPAIQFATGCFRFVRRYKDDGKSNLGIFTARYSVKYHRNWSQRPWGWAG